MVADHPVRLTDVQRRHQEVMRRIAEQLQDTPYVLKGGAALLLTRDGPRHSEDLDFDSNRKLNLERRLLAGLKKAGVETTRLIRAKDTATVQRFKIHYRDPQTHDETDQLLKIETSLRGISDPAAVEIVNGIRTYRIDTLYAQKLEALGARTAPRDLHDRAHLTQNYGNQIADALVARADAMTADVDELANRYEVAFHSDEVLSGPSNALDTALLFRQAVENERSRRAMAASAAITEEPEMAGSGTDERHSP